MGKGREDREDVRVALGVSLAQVSRWARMTEASIKSWEAGEELSEAKDGALQAIYAAMVTIRGAA